MDEYLYFAIISFRTCTCMNIYRLYQLRRIYTWIYIYIYNKCIHGYTAQLNCYSFSHINYAFKNISTLNLVTRQPCADSRELDGILFHTTDTPFTLYTGLILGLHPAKELMRDVVTERHRLSLAVCKPRISPAIHQHWPGNPSNCNNLAKQFLLDVYYQPIEFVNCNM